MTDPRQQAAEARQLLQRYIDNSGYEVVRPKSGDTFVAPMKTDDVQDALDTLCGRLEQAERELVRVCAERDLARDVSGQAVAYKARLEQAEAARSTT